MSATAKVKTEIAAQRQCIADADRRIEEATRMLYHDEYKLGNALGAARRDKMVAQRTLMALTQSIAHEAPPARSSAVFIGSSG